MSESRLKWRANRGARAIKSLLRIDASIAALKDDDLLDLADIFLMDPQTPLAQIALTEMARRKITL